MSRLDNALQNDIKALELLRDQLKVHASLLKDEARKRWEELEEKREILKEHLDKAQRATDAPRKELEAAAKHLSEVLKTGYADIKNALKKT